MSDDENTSTDFVNLIELSPEIITPSRLGSNSPDALYHSIGSALSSWEHLEERLCMLFCTYLNNPFSISIAKTYGCVLSHGGRVEMIKEAIYNRFVNDHVVREEHTKAIEKIRSLSIRRNEIAHGLVQSARVNGNSTGYLLIPPSYSTSKIRRTWAYLERGRSNQSGNIVTDFYSAWYKYHYTEEEVNKYADMFRLAAKDVTRIAIRLARELHEERAQ